MNFLKGKLIILSTSNLDLLTHADHVVLLDKVRKFAYGKFVVQGMVCKKQFPSACQ